MRVLVADDHTLFRDGIASLLEAAGFEVVGQVGDGQAAVEAVADLEPDLVLLDITMPGLSGLEALRQIKAAHAQAQVVMLTVSDDDEDLIEAIRSGARGYLLKSLTADQFIDLVRGVENGEAAITRRTAARLMEGVADGRRKPRGSIDSLTSRELALLRQVAQGASNKDIARSMSISQNTVKYYLKNILQKLNAHNRAEAASIALRAGLLDEAAS
jgi:DNA-binding NarL/FixJ family response regulator